MDPPGPFETDSTKAYFNVTLPEKNWTVEHVAEHMAAFNVGTVISTSVHEAYPGHYVQFLWMPQFPSKIRKVLGANTNIEGWAHYCEQMMLDQGYGQPGAGANNEREAKLIRLGQLQDALLRDARFVNSIKLHTGQFTFDQAVDFDMLVQRVRVGPTQAEAVQRRDPHGAGKIRVGAAARAAMSNVEAELSRNFASPFVQLERRGVRLPDWPRHAAGHSERSAIVGSGKGEHPLDAVIEVGLAFRHAQRLAATARGDAVHPFAAMYDSDAERAVLARHSIDHENLARHLADRRAARSQSRAGVTGLA